MPILPVEASLFKIYFGQICVQTITPEIAQALSLKEPKGALVGGVVNGGPAEAAGIKRGDVIVAYDGKEIKRMSDLPRLVAETPVGKTVEIKVIRDGKEMVLKSTISELPAGKIAFGGPVSEESLGMRVDNITPRWSHQLGIKDKSGVVVIGVAPNSPAEEAGIQVGDIIKEVNRKTVKNMKDYENAMEKTGKDKPVLLLIKRGGQTFYVSIKVS